MITALAVLGGLTVAAFVCLVIYVIVLAFAFGRAFP